MARRIGSARTGPAAWTQASCAYARASIERAARLGSGLRRVLRQSFQRSDVRRLRLGRCLARVPFRSPSSPLAAAGKWTRALGALLLAFAWIYPHFLQDPGIRYLYAAPLGTIPCPTLAAVVGVALLANGLVGKTWSALLVAMSGFYGLFGVFRLGVTIDILLLIGSIGLGVQAWRAKTKLA